MRHRPLTPQRVRRELRHLYRLQARDNFRSRAAAAARAVAGFGTAFAVAGKALIMKSVVIKVVLATVVGLLAAFPMVLLMSTFWLWLGLLAIVVVLAVASCEAPGVLDFPCGSCSKSPGSPDRRSQDSCDLRNERRRKLDAMIAVREAIVGHAAK